MIWFFERKGEHLRCEVRSQIEGDRYDLVITEPDGTERVETFSSSAELNKRSIELEKEWRSGGWDGPYMRFL